MPYSRQRPRIPATGRIAVRLTPAQRDVFLASPGLAKDLGHQLHRAPVREGKLAVRLTRAELDALIAVAAGVPVANPEADRALDTLLRYLEDLADQFELPPDA
jgi:hypothetical protein